MTEEKPLLQDMDSRLSKWFANTPNARQHAKEAAEAIKEKKDGV